ncbi:11559_t:CDS:2, partial [Diversispora eburnea]
PELAHVVIRIHGICVNSASVERLWSSMVAPIISNGEESNEEIKDLEDNESDCREIQVSDDDEDEINIRNEINNDEGDIDMWNEINNNNDEELNSEEQRLTQLIEEWIELGNWENKFDDENDQIFLSTEWNNDFNLGDREIHLADDDIAKWNLNILFESLLESPTFLGSDEIFTNAC